MTAMSPSVRLKELLGCPFCGNVPTVEPWHGGGPSKRAIHCENEDCPANPMVTGSILDRAIKKWNYRTRTD